MKYVMALTLPAMLGLTACGTSGHATNTFCTAARPIYMSKADKLTDGTARAIVGHNEVGAKLCSWKPPAGDKPK